MIKVRVSKAEDVARLLEIYAYYVENTAISFEYEVPSLAEFTERIRNTLVTYPYLMAEEDGKVYGLYILHPNNVGRCGHICNASYAVSSDARGRHIG